jgi:hypothetical protein
MAGPIRAPDFYLAKCPGDVAHLRRGELFAPINLTASPPESALSFLQLTRYSRPLFGELLFHLRELMNCRDYVAELPIH